MKRSGNEMNFYEVEQDSKSRKTLNFTRADRDASSSSSIGDVAGPEIAKDTGELAPRNFSRKFSWWDTRSYFFESPDETATPGRVLVLYSFEKNTPTTRRQDHSSMFDLLSMLTALGVYKNIWLYSQVGQTSRIGE